MGIQVQKHKSKIIKPGDVWYCHNPKCGAANEKKRGKQRQRCQGCGQTVWLKRKRK